jgi:hypothetical protein
MAESRRVNGQLKTKERARRDVRMFGLVQQGKLPYTPSVLSWLSAKLDKPSNRITQSDVDRLIKTGAKT